MKLYFTKTPNVIQRFFAAYVWRFNSKKKDLYLTFDDGPTEDITEFVLSELKKYNAKATFFCIGKNIENHPEIFKKIITDGHSLGNHTQNHLNGWKSKTAKYLENITVCEHIISSKIEESTNTKLFRPPYGKIKNRQGKQLLKLGYKIIMYDVLSADFDNSIPKEKCLKNVLKNAKNGSIIVFHDSIKASNNLQYTLPKVLEYYSKKGFSFKKI